MAAKPSNLDFNSPLPPEVAFTCAKAGAGKSSRDSLSLVLLGVLAGAFIALGAMFMTTVITGMSESAWGYSRLIAGVAFSLGLILIVICGAELFTGDSLMIVAWASKLISTRSLLCAWALVYFGNIVGGVTTAGLVFLAGQYKFAAGGVGMTALTIASAKAALPVAQLFFLAVLCNVLVCLAVWMSFAARSAGDKVLVIVPPITAFVAAGFEHSIANLYLLPYGLLVKGWAGPEFWLLIGRTASDFAILTLGSSLTNIIVATLGNLIGGSLMVGAIYWFIYLRRHPN